MATPWYNLHDGFDVAEARGQGECVPRESRRRVAAGGGVGQSGVGLDGVGEGGRRGLRIADTHLPREGRATAKKRSTWEGACCAGAGKVREPVEASPFGCSGIYGQGVRAGRGRGEARV